MNDTADLERLAYKSERAASRRLARLEGLSIELALRRTLEASAGRAGLPALLAARSALRMTEQARAAARAVVRDSVRAAAKARQAARHDGRPTAWRAWFDGSARPNPGRCGIGAVLKGPDGARVELALAAGHGNSSQAEYRALIAVLEAALDHGADDLTVYGDSRVVIDDVNGPDALAAPALAPYRARVHALAARIGHVGHLSLRWVPRHKNLEADALSQRAVDATLSCESESQSQSDAHELS